MMSSETSGKVVEELFEFKGGTEEIDPEVVFGELLDPEVGVNGVASGLEMLWVIIGVGHWGK